MAENAAFADAAGFSLPYTSDMPSTHREMHTTLTAIAGRTSEALIGSGVTNPITRDSTVFASAFASLSEDTGGRVFVGVGCGDSALKNSGSHPAKLNELKAFIIAVRSPRAKGLRSASAIE